MASVVRAGATFVIVSEAILVLVTPQDTSASGIVKDNGLGPLVEKPRPCS